MLNCFTSPKSPLGGFRGLLFFLLILYSCDSGDIYPDDDDSGNDIGVTAAFHLTGTESFPKDYLLIFGAFDANNQHIRSTTLIKPKAGENSEVSISSIPENTTTLQLCLTTLGRQPIHTFYTYPIEKMPDESIEIPLTEINLLQYERIQRQVFELNCTSCHGTITGAANLHLGEGVSYRNLVSKKSTNSDKYRVEPFNLSESFLMDVLEDETLELHHPHTTILSKEDDLDLLKAWIEAGAGNN